MTVQWTAAGIPDQHDRVAVVTGADSGFGYHIAAARARWFVTRTLLELWKASVELTGIDPSFSP